MFLPGVGSSSGPDGPIPCCRGRSQQRFAVAFFTGSEGTIPLMNPPPAQRGQSNPASGVFPERTFPSDGACQIEHPLQESLLCTLAVGHGGPHICQGIEWVPSVVPRSAPWGEGATATAITIRRSAPTADG